MNAKLFYRILTILLGYGLIIGGFISFGKSLDNNILVLDIVASCLVYTQLVQLFVFPMIDLDKAERKEVGMMGIHYYTLNVCCLLSLLVMALGIVCEWAFKIQLMLQLAVLMLLFVGRVATLHAGDKVVHVHQKEQKIMSGKKQLRAVMDELKAEAAYCREMDAVQQERLQKLCESVRFVSPSVEYEARRADDQIIQSVDNLTLLMRNAKNNKTKIDEELNLLEIALNKRKKY